MEALFMSTAIVAIAEIGDKTQLLSFVLSAKLKSKYAILAGIFAATLANHTFAGYVGAWLASLISPDMLKWLIASSFFAFGLWALRPDTLDRDRKLHGRGAFVTTLIAFFFVEMGDKTQLATVALAARYDALMPVVMGTTLGMLIANAPAVWIGEVLAHRVNMKAVRWVAAASFVGLGVWTLASGGVKLS